MSDVAASDCLTAEFVNYRSIDTYADVSLEEELWQRPHFGVQQHSGATPKQHLCLLRNEDII